MSFVLDKSKIKAVVLDVDNTLAPDNSWLKITRELGASEVAHEQIFAEYVAGKISYNKAKNELLTIWRMTGNHNSSYMQKMFDCWELYPEAYTLVDYLKTRYQVCLISGSVDMWVSTVARKLNVSDWFANTRLIWDPSGWDPVGRGYSYLLDFDYSLKQAQKKVKQKNVFLAGNLLLDDQCVVVGDGANDKMLFEECASILVGANPHPDLVALATAHVDELSDVMNYL